MSRVLNDDLLRRVAYLRIAARQVARGGSSADQRSRELGSGMEFRDFRAYVPGDDIRRVDWNLYRRSRRLFVRLFEAQQNLPVYILLDVSDSMFFESPPRVDSARQMAAILAAVALNDHDRVGIYPFGDGLLTPLAPTSARQSLPRLLGYLERLAPGGPTDIAGAARRFGAQRLRSGLAVLISDFFDARGMNAVLDGLRSLRHRLALIQLVRSSDGTPALDGELRLLDCESGRGVEVSVTSETLLRYRQAYQRFDGALSRFAATRNMVRFCLDVDRPLLEQLGGLFVDGTLVV